MRVTAGGVEVCDAQGTPARRIFVNQVHPTVEGKLTWNYPGTSVNDDDCTNDQGKFWYDDNGAQMRFEFCNANSGTPAVLGGAGAIAFLDLTDVDPTDYTGDAGKVVRVNSAPDGLEFADAISVDHTTPALSVGDILYWGGTEYERLAPGTTGQLLQANGDEAAPSWVTSGAGGNSFTTMDASAGTDPVADTSTDTLVVTGTSPVTVTGDSGADSLTIAVANADDDGTTKGAASFADADFDCTTGNCSIAAAMTRDAEWDTAAEINTATTDDDFATLTGTQTLTNKTYDAAGTGNVFTIEDGTGVSAASSGQLKLDTNADQLVYFGAAAKVIDPRQTLSAVLMSPVDADTPLIFKAPYGMVITDIDCITGAATSAVIDVQECTSAGATCATVDATITCDSDGAADDGSLTNGTIDAGDWIKLDIGTVTGTVLAVTVTITYTVVQE